MKSTILLVSTLVLFSACATAPNGVGGGGIGLPDCDILVVPPNCSNSAGSGPATPKVTFNTNSLVVAPRNVCAAQGSKITIELKPPNSKGHPRLPGTVAVIPKDISNAWLIGTNSPDEDKIEITVPSHIPLDTYYGYTLVISDGGVVQCVDPRVHVQN